MPSLQDRAEAVKAAVASSATCTTTTTVLLKDLLRDDSEDTATEKTGGKVNSNNARRTKATTARPASRPTAEEGLRPKEKAALATVVVNTALKALSEASKSAQATQPTATATENDGEEKSESRRRLRRSNSAPPTPLQPRSLNRVSTSPIANNKVSRQTTSRPSALITACLPLVECIHAAFSCLVSLQNSGKASFAQRQLESGMSVFIGKLLGLGLQEQALRQLGILKKQIETTENTTKSNKKRAPAPAPAPATSGDQKKDRTKAMAELLDFGNTTATGQDLGLVIATQIHVLRVLAATKKPAAIEAAVPFLRLNHPSSPTMLLLRYAAESESNKTKAARQLEQISQLILLLPPHVSSKEDANAMEMRLSCTPLCALELQALALRSRLHWWKLAGHSADVDEDLLTPLSRCLAAFVRRCNPLTSDTYRECLDAYQGVTNLIQELELCPSTEANSTTVAIYQALGGVAQGAKLYKQAASWFTKVRSSLRPEQDSPARCCAVAAQLLAVVAKQDPLPMSTLEALLTEVLKDMLGNVKGDNTELQDVMSSLSTARRSVVGILAAEKEHKSASRDGAARRSVFQLCNKMVLQFPRFALRWIGKQPPRDADPKHTVRYEQRRQALLSTVTQVLDSALACLKAEMDANTITWEEVDSTLQDSLQLLEAVGESSLPARKSDGENSYHVKTSQLYFLFCKVLQNQGEDEGQKPYLRSMKRSIDVVRDRSSKERAKAHLVTKLERFAHLCRRGGRQPEARDALKLICTNMVEDGVLSVITTSLNEESPSVAWNASPEAGTLSRTLAAMVKLDQSWSDWTFFLADLERAAVLEHLLQILLSEASRAPESNRHADAATDALLRVYTVERFPVRRLRTLLHLLALQLGGEAFTSLQEQAEAALQASHGPNRGDDASLARYVPHLQAYLASMGALLNNDSAACLEELESSLTTWRQIMSRCKSADDLFRNIDNPEQLLRHLESLAQFAGLKGEDALRLIALQLSADISQLVSVSLIGTTVLSYSALADHYIAIGYEAKAKEVLSKALTGLEPEDAESEFAWANLQLSWVEYQMAIHKPKEAEAALTEAQSAFEKHIAARGQSTSIQRRLLLARAALVQSYLTLDRGDTQQALAYSRASVLLLFQTWVKMEARGQASGAEQSSQLSISVSGDDSAAQQQCQRPAAEALRCADGPDYWALACALLRSLSRLSAVYAHVGMFQETLYYADKALDVAESIDSLMHKTQAQTWIGSIWIKATKLEKGLKFLGRARDMLSQHKPTHRAMQLSCELGASYRLARDYASEEQLFQQAEDMLKGLEGSSSNNPAGEMKSVEGAGNVLEKMQKLTIKETVPTRTTRTTTRGAAAQTRAKATKKPAPTTRTTRTGTKATAARSTNAPSAEAKAKAMALPAAILVRKAVLLLDKKLWAAASDIYEQLQQAPIGFRHSLEVQANRAACLIGQSLEQMIHDPVFSVVQDSTISFPSVATVMLSEKGTVGEKATQITSPPAARKPRGKAASAMATAAIVAQTALAETGPVFVNNLKQALIYLSEAHAMAIITGDGHLVHRISALLQSTTILLSAASTPDLNATPSHMGFATYSMELARNVTWKRERQAIVTELEMPAKVIDRSWPSGLGLEDSTSRRRVSLVSDVNKFQRDFINIIPAEWSVISISLSENRHDLCITKLQSQHTPFVIRLPLERATSRDADSEAFNFEQGHAEMKELIRLVNGTCHDTRDWTAPGAKKAWWEEREALNTRMERLLENIEHTWLGGFRGIFSQHQRRSDLLAAFHKSFQAILDKHLPSRRRVRGKKVNKAPKITLDTRILDLFIGLGDPSAPDRDLDEALNDLLYFVVDVLQFHGERNAYDEIDFDSMVVETYDALSAYYAGTSKAARGTNGAGGGGASHTILVLDKALHVFPWESMACLQNLAVSRVPSMAYLRKLIFDQLEEEEGKIGVEQNEEDEMNEESDEDLTTSSSSSASFTVHGQDVSPLNGTYILNPGSDLPQTLETFEKPLRSLGSTWTSIVSREPTEPEFETALVKSDILLYFGHGSGAQYIRSKTIRRLEKCRATVLLMGCSSASLVDAGEFEVHGPVWNYMMAGCPAVVGTLWDVTDKDVDRYAGRLFEEWGLIERGTFVTDRWSARRSGGSEAGAGTGSGDGERKTLSLSEAVVRAREACRFRYITAGAVCVYGIPVFVKPRKGKKASQA